MDNAAEVSREERERRVPSEILSVSGREISDGTARPASTAGTADTVDITMCGKRKVVVDDEFDALEVDTAGQDVSADKEEELALTEAVEEGVTLCQCAVAMEDIDGERVGPEEAV